MSFWTGMGNSLKSFFEEPSQNSGLRILVMHYTRSYIDCKHRRRRAASIIIQPERPLIPRPLLVLRAKPLQ